MLTQNDLLRTNSDVLKQNESNIENNVQNKENNGDFVNRNETKKIEKERQENEDRKIQDYGQATLDQNECDYKIHLLTIIGEVEGHECLPQTNKTTKYEHVLPQLAAIEDSAQIDGVLILINTVGGDVEAGLAIAEMIASLSKPTVTLVLGGSHSIGVPLAVSSNYSFIVPTATMIIHPVRMSGMIIGVAQTYDYFERIQDRILSFVVDHSSIDKENLKELMLNTTQLVKDVGTILVGKEAVEKGIIDEVGGINDAMNKMYELINEGKSKK